MGLRLENRTRAELVNLGPGARDLAALMDQSQSVLLQKGLDALKAGATTQTYVAVPALFAGVPAPAMTIVGPWAIATQGFDAIMTIGLPQCRGGGTSCSATEDSGPKGEVVTVGGNPGVIFTTTTLTGGVDAGRISIDVSIATYGEVHEVGTGAVIYRIEGTGTGHIAGDACPDASGVARVHLDFTAKENYFSAAGLGAGGARVGYGLEQRYSADVSIHADDNANLAGVDIVAQAHEESKGGVRAAGAGQSELHAYNVDAAGTQSFGYDPATGFTGGGLGVDTASSVDALRLAGGLALYTAIPAKRAAKLIETSWRSGRCIAVTANPNGGNVDRESVTSVTVSVKQKFEGTELNKPVEAVSFTGVRAFDAVGQKLPAPGTFHYIAGSNKGDKGSVTFQSVSNRGIGKIGVTFVVGEPEGYVFEATLTATQTDHEGTKAHIFPAPGFERCVADRIETHSADQTFAVKSEPVRIDALPLPASLPGWGDQRFVLVAHGQPFMPPYTNPLAYPGLDQGSSRDAPAFPISLPSTVQVNRHRDTPGVPPLPAVAYDNESACTEGDPGHPQPTETSDCGPKEYQVGFVIQVPAPNKLYPAVNEQGGLPDDLYARCVGLPDTPMGIYGCTACLEQVQVGGGDFPTASILDATVPKIEISGTATLLFEAEGGLTTQDLAWTLTLCRVVNDKPAC